MFRQSLRQARSDKTCAPGDENGFVTNVGALLDNRRFRSRSVAIHLHSAVSCIQVESIFGIENFRNRRNEFAGHRQVIQQRDQAVE